MTVTEKAAYLKGLAEGLELDENSKEGKIIAAMIDTIEDMALTIADLEDGMAEVCDQIDAIDEDLDALEEDIYGELDDEELDDDIYEVECPACGDTVCVDASMLEQGEMNCPNCGELLEFDLDDLDELSESEDCDCCGHHHGGEEHKS